uniref:Uncharacterized protein n=1 Tax=Rhizophora mucronata TaxID=61149 RepID=A0A2P2PWR2_RHIMU
MIIVTGNHSTHFSWINGFWMEFIGLESLDF